MRRRALASLGLAGLLAACAQTATTGTPGQAPVFLVFFEDDSIALNGDAQRVVEQAVAIARANPSASIRVSGFIAPDPQHAPTVALARARAEHVANVMVSQGIAQGRVRVEGRGVAQFTSAPVESRRVEIRIG
jgi:cytochrome c oxidase subunit 2